MFSSTCFCSLFRPQPASLSTVLFQKLTGSHLVKHSPHFMEPESWLPHSQQPVTCVYTEPDQSSPFLPIPLLKIHFLLFLSYNVGPRPSEMFTNIANFAVKRCSHLARTLRWIINNCPLSCIPEGLSYIRNMGTHHAVQTKTKLSRLCIAQKGQPPNISTPNCPRRLFHLLTRGLASTTHDINSTIPESTLLKTRTVNQKTEGARNCEEVATRVTFFITIQSRR
jgi:hypothetical protein